MSSVAEAPPASCPKCETRWAPRIRACPGCGKLVHARELERLAAEAATAKRAGDVAAERTQWTLALELLPAGSKQAKRIAARVAVLSQDSGSKPTAGSKQGAAPKWLAGLGTLGLFFWKAKAILLFVATKAKLLFSGFASWQTILSMGLTFGIYWTAWGWTFALGFIVSIYIHELGHLVALRRYGIPASAPMFIPGVGAFVRLDRHPATPEQDARVGLAGPWFGLGAALTCYGLFLLTGEGLLAALAQVGAWINLFNLVPIWQLDGGRAFAGMARSERGIALAVVGGALLVSQEKLLILLALGAAFRWLAPSDAVGDRGALVQYAILVCALTALATVGAPIP